MTTKEQTQPSFTQRLLSAIRRDAKAPRQYSVLDQTGDILDETFRRIFLVLSILVISGFIAALMPPLLATPNGPADMIATVYFEACKSSGVCDLPTLNAGFAIAVVALSGLSLALLAAIRRNPNTGLYERFEDVQDQLDRLEIYTMPNDELPESFVRQSEGD